MVFALQVTGSLLAALPLPASKHLSTTGLTLRLSLATVAALAELGLPGVTALELETLWRQWRAATRTAQRQMRTLAGPTQRK